jgi:ATP-binding cassette, subfamily B (MDR/TAP), member 1
MEVNDGFDGLEDLPLEEQGILKKQVELHKSKTSYFTLFRYASHSDMVRFTFAIFCAVVSGIAIPIATIVFGQMAGAFQDYILGATSASQFTSALRRLTL